MKVVTIVGARPQFIKAAAVSRELRRKHTEILVHTGQHYDHSMSGVFFEGLEIPAPDINLEVGSGDHGAQTGAMLAGIEKALKTAQPDWLLIYGDTNSTLAGALAAAKLHIPVAHVEAGLRSFNRRMPEEVNRVVADHVSRLLLCPSRVAVDNLAAEGIKEGVHVVGDVMLDVLQWARQRSEERPTGILQRLGLSAGGYLLTTIHRSENTDDLVRLRGIFEALNSISETIVFPIHPRTRKVIAASGLKVGSNIRMVEPLGYCEMVAVSGGARLILTDSGGLQKEAYWLGVPCVTLRDETEWVETVEAGWNTLAGAETGRILEAAAKARRPAVQGALYGEVGVAARCVQLMQ